MYRTQQLRKAMDILFGCAAMKTPLPGL